MKQNEMEGGKRKYNREFYIVPHSFFFHFSVISHCPMAFCLLSPNQIKAIFFPFIFPLSHRPPLQIVSPGYIIYKTPVNCREEVYKHIKKLKNSKQKPHTHTHTLGNKIEFGS